MDRAFIAIDLKSFYASVECVERGLDPLTAKLVVADVTRTEKTICLAVSPALKALGVPGRPRLFEVTRYAKNVEFLVAPPQMKKYMEISRKIVGIYEKYIAPADIHVYSVDEVFIDATSYLKNYKMSAEELARTMIKDVLRQTGITATAGIGTNLYLAKVAMDILAKKMPADEHGVRVASLNERSYREKLWEHEPLTDFWRVGKGYQKRLNGLGIKTMGDLAYYSLSGSAKLYQTFGVNAELLVDHAWGYEPVEISDIKGYESENHSLSQGQVLSRPYRFEEAKIVVLEMVDALALELVEKNLVADQVVLSVGYDNGRAHGTENFGRFTSSEKVFSEKTLELFEKIVDPDLTVRRICVVANHVKREGDISTKPRQASLFDGEHDKEDEKSKKLQEAEIAIKKRYGKNAILKAISYEEGATARARNRQIGGHKA